MTEGEGPVVLQCQLHDYVLVSPDDVTWRDGEGNVMSADSLPDNMKFDKHTLKLTINVSEGGSLFSCKGGKLLFFLIMIFHFDFRFL